MLSSLDSKANHACGKIRRMSTVLSAAIPRLAGQRARRSNPRTRRSTSASHNPSAANTARKEASRTIASCACKPVNPP